MADCLEDTSSDYELAEAARQRGVAAERARARDFRDGAAAGGADASFLQRGFDAGLRLGARASSASAAAQALLRCALALALQRRLAPPPEAEAAAHALLDALVAGARPFFRALRASGAGGAEVGDAADGPSAEASAASATAAAAEILRALLLRLREQLAEARGLLNALFGGRAAHAAAVSAADGASADDGASFHVSANTTSAAAPFGAAPSAAVETSPELAPLFIILADGDAAMAELLAARRF